MSRCLLVALSGKNLTLPFGVLKIPTFLYLFLVGWSCLKFRNSTSNDFSHGIAKRSGDYFFYALDFPYIKQFVALCHALVTEYFTVIKEATSISHKSLSCTDR